MTRGRMDDHPSRLFSSKNKDDDDDDCFFQTIQQMSSSSNNGNHNCTFQVLKKKHILHYLQQQNNTMTTVQDAMEHVLLLPSVSSSSSSSSSAMELLDLGSIWYLSESAPRHPSLGQKPIRLTSQDASMVLKAGDYLRIHFHPRRYPPLASSMKNMIHFIDHEKRFLIVNKPSFLPVHSTVDNALENVVSYISTHLQQTTTTTTTEQVYVSTPQRLDQNTTGLLIVSTKPTFAAYFAESLRRKTDYHLQSTNTTTSVIHNNKTQNSVFKQYTCLLCIFPTSNNDNNNNNHIDLLKNGTIITHYLEPSIRAPKVFTSVQTNETYLPCLLKIIHVEPPIPITPTLQQQLFPNHTMPPNCSAIQQVTVELLTGRTHQIRGQFAAMGMPLVGDTMYGGAIQKDNEEEEDNDDDIPHYLTSPKLALQCSHLSFIDPDTVLPETKNTTIQKQNKRKKKKEKEHMIPSSNPTRWNTFTLKEAWWTHIIHPNNHQEQNIPQNNNDTHHPTDSDDGLVRTSKEDEQLVQQLQQQLSLQKQQQKPPTIDEDAIDEDAMMKDIPPLVQLSPGVHKYVLIAAKGKENGKKYWFVKSASPQECGGPYHANVAESLVNTLLESNHFTNVQVTGGGRIDFSDCSNYDDDDDDDGDTISHAHVFGFSYGFGKGDHARAAQIIEKFSNNKIVATYDTSNNLY